MRFLGCTRNRVSSYVPFGESESLPRNSSVRDLHPALIMHYSLLDFSSPGKSRSKVKTLLRSLAMVVALTSLHSEPLPTAPEDFISFTIPGKEQELAQLRNLYWSNYKNPATGLPSLWFPWMTGTELAPASEIAAEKRDQWSSNLEKIKMFPDGYVSVGQHYSHAHDGGWPFPLWPQIFEPGNFQGYTAGWHFQDHTEGFIQVMFMDALVTPAGLSGDAAIEKWEISDLESEERVEGLWRLRVVGPNPTLTLKPGPVIQASMAPFMQIRQRSDFDPPTGDTSNVSTVVLQWKREGDADFSSEREVSAPAISSDPWERASRLNHSLFETWKHPMWKGNIIGLRILLPALEEGATYDIDSIFTAFDTRQPVTNPGFILGLADYFRWTGDRAFLAKNIDRMRTALDFCRKELGGDEFKFIRVPWVGHDGLSGYVRQPDGTLKRRYGVGIGNNYWDLLPFGGDDMYATTYFYAALRAQEEIEQWVAEHGQGIAAPPAGSSAADLGKLAAEVKETANQHFWNEKTGRFIACVDREGVRHDFGYTFVNLEAVYYGLANDEHARSIMDWIEGDRLVEGDTSQGKDIYRFRFGPRASTLKNNDWYLWAWPGMDVPWGEQVQDGGAVLGFAYHDLMARLRLRGADDASRRMDEMLAWLVETQKEGGFRDYYAKDSSRGLMQGGGGAGGLGMDVEFVETEMWPSVLLSGFAGFHPNAEGFSLEPNLPEAWKSLKIAKVAFRDSVLTLVINPKQVTISVVGETPGEILVTSPGWTLTTARSGDLRPGGKAVVQLKNGLELTFKKN